MLAVVRGNDQDCLHHIRPIGEPIRRVHPDRPPVERRKRLLIMLVLKAAALSGGRQNYSKTRHGSKSNRPGQNSYMQVIVCPAAAESSETSFRGQQMGGGFTPSLSPPICRLYTWKGPIACPFGLSPAILCANPLLLR